MAHTGASTCIAGDDISVAVGRIMRHLLARIMAPPSLSDPIGNNSAGCRAHRCCSWPASTPVSIRVL